MPDDAQNAIETAIPILAAPIGGGLAPSPYSFAFTGEDRLKLTVFNSVAGVRVAVHLRMHRPDAFTHASRYEFAPDATRLASTTEFVVGAGYLLNVVVLASAGSPKIGQTFVKVQVIRGSGAAAVVLGTIVQDYVTANQDVAWPGSPIHSSIEGGGVIRTVRGTQPAPTNQIVETVPTGARWEVIAVQAHFTAVAAGVDRGAYFTLISGGSTVTYIPHVRNCGPGATADWGWAQGLPIETAMGSGQQTCGLPTAPTLLAGDAFQVLATNLAGGDQFLAPLYIIREWLEAQ